MEKETMNKSDQDQIEEIKFMFNRFEQNLMKKVQQKKQEIKDMKQRQKQELKELQKKQKQELKEQQKQQKQELKEKEKQEKAQQKEMYKNLTKEQKKQFKEEQEVIKKQKQQELKIKREQNKKEKLAKKVEQEKKKYIKNNVVSETRISEFKREEIKDLDKFIRDNTNYITERLQQIFEENGKIKVQVKSVIHAHQKILNEQTKKYDFKNENFPVFSDFKYRIESSNPQQVKDLLSDYQYFTEQKQQSLTNSQLVVDNFSHFEIITVPFEQEIGDYIKLEEKILKKQACKNIENKDDYCLIYCYMLRKYILKMKQDNQKVELKHLERVSNYKFNIQDNILNIESVNNVNISEQIDITNIKFPCSEQDIIRFTRRCKINVTLFDFKIKNDKITFYPVINEIKQDQKNFDLLLIKNDQKQHLVLITNINRLLYQKDNGHKDQFYCRRCVLRFNTKQQMKLHYQQCIINKDIVSRDVFPNEKNDILQFTNYKYQVQIPFIFFADFESILIKLEKQTVKKRKNFISLDEVSNTQKLDLHQVVSYGLQIHSFDQKDDEYFEFSSANPQEVIENFINKILEKTEYFDHKINNINIPYNLSKEEQIKLKKQAKVCYICNNNFTDEKDKVIDHLHLNGEIRGIAHSACNLQFNLYKSKIPIIMHNLRGYDSHFIIQHLGKVIKNKVQQIDNQLSELKQNQSQNQELITKLNKEKHNIQRIDCIVQNNEKVQSFTHNKNKFIDSLQFMASSLSKLADKLKPEQKQYTIQYIQNKYNFLSQERILQLINKGIFPYSYLDNYNKLQETEFPAHEHFFSNLTQSNISEQDYQFAKNLYSELKMKNFKEYLYFYQAIDVKLLADVWLNFRDMCFQFYKLDPGYFVSSPSLSYQAMLKFTNVQIELIKDPEIHQMFEQSIRGGNSNTGSICYAESNNQYQDDYDENKEKVFIQYYDANNLYGDAMSRKLPVGDYKFIDSLSEQDILNYDHNSDLGYLIKCDLIYPEELHNAHNDFPLAIEKMCVKNEDLSEYQQNAEKQICEEQDIKMKQSNIKKLVGNLNDKTDYICDIRVLQLYLKLGLKLKQIKKVVQYKQSDFLKSYIDFNTQQRNIAKQQKDDFKIDFFKLMNNAVFGKTLENIRNRADYKIVFDKKQMQKIINKRVFKNYINISEDCLLVSQYKKETILNKAIQIGATILDLSKHKMYDLYYNNLKKMFNDIQLCYTDTDSLVVVIKNEEDVYQKMMDNNQIFDFSGIKPSSPLFNILQDYFQKNQFTDEQKDQFILNSMRIGNLKEECINDPIREITAIKSKCYAYKNFSEKEVKKIKVFRRELLINLLIMKIIREHQLIIKQ